MKIEKWHHQTYCCGIQVETKEKFFLVIRRLKIPVPHCFVGALRYSASFFF